MAAFPPLPFVTPQTAATIRERVVEAAARRPRPDVYAVADRLLPGPNGDTPVRICHPRPAGSLPVPVSAHGGGWSICGIETHAGICREIANRNGCAVVSVE
ncbi:MULTISPECIES: alpha/beta hydrolase fold domain-containing protein [unclassified Embleya]|uniref:alpha/beta hydrolase fold domain-containing protein n=1 Tax=unclassified Embleya TaxID=2699296 RepID=UPI00367FFF47